MITTEKKTTSVNFAKQDSKGTIAISGSYKGYLGNITLQQIAAEIEKSISEKLTPEEIADLPKVILNFNSPKSVEFLIGQLREQKVIMESFHPTIISFTYEQERISVNHPCNIILQIAVDQDCLCFRLIELPIVIMNFYSAKSIDVLIEQLTWLRNMFNGEFTYAMAC